LYLQQEVSQQECRAFVVVEGEYSFFTVDGSTIESLFQEVYPPGLGLIASKVSENQTIRSKRLTS